MNDGTQVPNFCEKNTQLLLLFYSNQKKTVWVNWLAKIMRVTYNYQQNLWQFHEFSIASVDSELSFCGLMTTQGSSIFDILGFGS